LRARGAAKQTDTQARAPTGAHTLNVDVVDGKGRQKNTTRNEMKVWRFF